MKQTLKQKLAELVPAWQGQVRDALAPGELVNEPCAVIAFAEEVPKSSWAGYRRIIRIAPYARLTEGGAEQLEVWSSRLMEGLHQVRLQDTEGNAFTCIYLGSSDCDRIDSGAGFITRSLRFGVYVPEVIEQDLVIETQDYSLLALQNWTQAELGSSWSVYRDTWPGGYESPSVLWRLASYDIAEAGASTLEIRKQFVGHVMTGNSVTTRNTVIRLVEQLGIQARIAITSVGSEGTTESRRYVTVDDVSADLQADAYLNGQIRLTLQERIRRPGTDVPFIRQVHHSRGIE
ncbi:hypothetical protein [Paenibacillus tundrae]|uniref:Uncharacterized protein n=1 Tax=Paenibacillus tundrae TaxID=528187 RepID=A0ABT9WAK9_9BACL|nr:hypothetical protein [Paenibacillus tundrae]MDQ0170251.1 hypothetical protein [Paenibacillus tundrae]